MLDGVRVLELSRVLAGPWAGQLLADWGADVIKVERPGAGDDTRHWGPPWIEGGAAAYFASTNRGKRSIAVDLGHPDGPAVVRKLAASADVVVENFKVGGLRKYGLDPEALRAAFPRLIVASISGYGQTGPWADRPGYDLLVQGMGGLMSITGSPDGPPTKVGVAKADLMTGMYAVSAILAALFARERTGQGRWIELGLLDTQVAALANQATNHLAGITPTRRGNAHPNLVPYQPFETSDGWVTIGVGNDGQFGALARACGADWAEDPRFGTNADRVNHRDDLVPAIAAVIGGRTSAAWDELLSRAGVPCAPILTVDQVFEHPQVMARGAVVDQGGIRTVRQPVFVDGRRLTASRPPPGLGEHTDAILTELGEDPSDWRARGVVG